MHIWVTDGTGTIVARNFINFEHFVEAVAPIESRGSKQITLNYVPDNISASSWEESTKREQLFSGVGNGYVEYEISLPEGLNPAAVAEMELIFEASSSYGGARQTEPEQHPSDVTISVNGVEIDTIRIPDCPADARGVLSYIHGESGIYGYLHNIKFEASRVLKGASNTLTVRYAAKDGFALYGARRGRYPIGPHVVIHL